MVNDFISGKRSAKLYWKLFKILLLICNTASLFIYSLLRLIFFDFMFEPLSEVMILVKLFSVASSFAAAGCLLVLASDGIEKIWLLMRSSMSRFFSAASGA